MVAFVGVLVAVGTATIPSVMFTMNIKTTPSGHNFVVFLIQAGACNLVMEVFNQLPAIGSFNHMFASPLVQRSLSIAQDRYLLTKILGKV
mmetsp:Transcript_28615/g.57598  ORF Transcript_28615/g.57598 Transcript_28615/m.57598 type:complete len:90 (-) Transcript_28615:145-414(-)